MYVPKYIKTYKSGLLEERIKKAYTILENCTFCPRNCKINRLKSKKGICNTTDLPIISDYFPHFGEETPLVGKYGSGTIFISYCSLLCMYCQNYEISHLGEGEITSIEKFADMMISLQKRNCHNINIVTPTHIVPQLLKALKFAIEKGLHIPLVYNTGGYEKLETLKLLDGIVDIYMPDFKYWSPEAAKRYSNAYDYPDIAKKAIKEMHRQVGELKINEESIAEEGLLVRHLVLPRKIAGTKEIAKLIAEEISPNTYVNVMAQYRPCGLADRDDFINRGITQKEYMEAIESALDAGLKRLDKGNIILYHKISH
ncbi:MAG: radical SAM protein [Desulfurellaceae bacterium]|nr:radical SAM protein [Desulfurellaceae bacterium]